ncbi:phage scaffolding protein [Megamonas funiformis]|uniref:phage scaffolding protein n=1 Tax=Megamonas funiformis TaxID=437897 RepID=UPI003FEF82DD
MTIEEYIALLNLDGEAKKKATESLKNLLKDSYVEKTKFDEAAVAKSNLETQIKERDKQLDTLKKTAGDKEKLEATIKQLQEDNKSAKTKYETDLKNLRIDSAVKLKLSGTAQDVDIVASLIDKTKLIVSDDGTVTGLDEQINPLKQSKPFLFKNDKQSYEPKVGGNPINNPFSKEHFNLTEQGKLFRENPQQARALAQAAGVNIGGIN